MSKPHQGDCTGACSHKFISEASPPPADGLDTQIEATLDAMAFYYANDCDPMGLDVAKAKSVITALLEAERLRAQIDDREGFKHDLLQLKEGYFDLDTLIAWNNHGLAIRYKAQAPTGGTYG